MIVFAIFNNCPLTAAIVYGNHSRFAFVKAGPCTGPIDSFADCLVSGETEVADFQLPTAPTSVDKYG